MSGAEYIEGGFFLLARKIIHSSLFSMSGNDVKLAIYILARARYEDRAWFCRYHMRDIIIGLGELTTTISELSEGTRLTSKETRTSLNHLLSHGIIENITPEVVKRANGYTHLKVCKYDTYQNASLYDGQSKGSQGASEGHIYKQIKNGKKETISPADKPPEGAHVPSKPKKNRHQDPHANAYKAIFDEVCPQPYTWNKQDFVPNVGLPKFRKERPTIGEQEFADMARYALTHEDVVVRTMASTIAALCKNWAQIAMKRYGTAGKRELTWDERRALQDKQEGKNGQSAS